MGGRAIRPSGEPTDCANSSGSNQYLQLKEEGEEEEQDHADVYKYPTGRLSFHTSPLIPLTCLQPEIFSKREYNFLSVYLGVDWRESMVKSTFRS
jgi:hypothetical protein